MNPRILERLGTLSASLWFRPSLMVVGSVVLFAGVRWADVLVDPEALPSWLQLATADGARPLLTAIVQSVVGVAGVTFSVTMAALIMATAQYGPRLLREFTKDRGSQRVLGVFMGTAVFSLLALGTLDQDRTHPHLTVVTATLLGVSSFAALIYFIHRISVAIQVDDLASRVSREYRDALDRLVPAAGPEAPPVPFPVDHLPAGTPIRADEMGYVQTVNEPALVSLAEAAGGVLRLHRRPGELVMAGVPLAVPFGGTGWNETRVRAVREAFQVGALRSPHQDLLLSMHQLLEVGLRALSPAMNDPFVARAALDRLAHGLALLAERPPPAPNLTDEAGQVRVVRRPVHFQEALEDAFDHLRSDASRNLTITLHLLDLLGLLGAHARRSDDREAVKRQIALLASAASRNLAEVSERDRVLAQAARVRERLDAW